MIESSMPLSDTSVVISAESWFPATNAGRSDLYATSNHRKALEYLRKTMNSFCSENGIRHAHEMLASYLKAEDPDGSGYLTLIQFSRALGKLGVTIRKFWLRALRHLIFDADRILHLKFLEILNADEWWHAGEIARSRCDLSSTVRNEGRASSGLNNVSGNESSEVLLMQDSDGLRSSGDTVRKHAPKTRADSRKQILATRSAVSPYQQAASQPIGGWLFPKLKTNESAPTRNTVVEKRGGMIPEQNKLSGTIRMHASSNDARGYSKGLSRIRALTYASPLESSDSPQRRSLEYTTKFWRKSPFPSSAIEYRRWVLLKDVVPGFSHPKQVGTGKSPHAEWQVPTGRGPVQSELVYEDKTRTCLQALDLKMQRSDSNAALEAKAQLRFVRTLVIKGEYDNALKGAKTAFQQQSKLPGMKGLFGHPQVDGPQQYVSMMVKKELSKLMRVSHDHLNRNQFQKAHLQIPNIRSAYHWLCENQSEGSDPEGGNMRITSGKREMDNVLQDIENLTEQIISGEKASVLAIEASSLNTYFVSIRKVFDQSDPLSLQEPAVEMSRNILPSNIVADGRTYTLLLDLKHPNLPDHLNIGTRLMIQGAATLGSGRKDDGSKPRRGTVTAFNERSSKYKVQYSDEYEWISWPCSFKVNIDIYPEEVAIEIPGFAVKSKTVDMSKNQSDQIGALLVTFIVIPQGPPFDFSHFGTIQATATGFKSGKSLLDALSCCVEVAPPEFLLPAAQYMLFDSITNEALDNALIEFTEQASGNIFRFINGEPVSVPRLGVYNICFRAHHNFDEPSLIMHHCTCVVFNQGTTRVSDCQKIFLNRPITKPNELRILVAWGSEPLELDVHVYTSAGQHFDYTSVGGFLDESRTTNSNNTLIRLNMDSSSGFGPETATIKVKKACHYSFSVSIQEGQKWIESHATVSLFDSTGLFLMFRVPSDTRCSNHSWWHVFALDGSQWDRHDHGILRVNLLSTKEMPEVSVRLHHSHLDTVRKRFRQSLAKIKFHHHACISCFEIMTQQREIHFVIICTLRFCLTESLSQLAAPGWPMIEALKNGYWDEFCERLQNLFKANVNTESSMLNPRDLANMISLQGETVLGIICSYNEDSCSAVDEGDTPLQKQVRALHLFLKEAGMRAQAGESLMSGGLPTTDTFQKECSLRGPDDCFLFRAVTCASKDVAVLVITHVNAFTKRSIPGNGYRRFFQTHGDELLLACVESRKGQDLVSILRVLLDNDDVWMRRATRKFQKGDPVQLEHPPESADWVDGVIEQTGKAMAFQRVHDTFHVRLIRRHQKTRDVCVQGGVVTEDGGTVVNDVPASNLRWRSYAVERMRSICRREQEQLQHMSHHQRGTRKDQTEAIKSEALSKEALTMLLEKAFIQ